LWTEYDYAHALTACRWKQIPLLNLASPLFASTRSDPCSPPMLPLMATSGFPLPAQSRSVHPMQTSWAENHQTNYQSPQRCILGFCTKESIILLVLVPRSPLPPITSIGPFPRILTLPFLPVMTMNDHPYASVSTSTVPPHAA
jgi:hypothetical protein